MTEAQIKGGGAGDQLLPGTETRTSAKNVSTLEQKIVCPDCGGSVHFGSRDVCEGDYFWCDACSNGPILFPIGTREIINRPPNEDRIRGYPGGVFVMAHDILKREDTAAYLRSE